MRPSIKSTSTRTFVIIPSAVLLEQLVSRRRLHLKYLPMLAWGYLQYRLAGDFRTKRAGGPSGMSQGFPESIVTDGIYKFTRNPMYLGHMIFLTGLTLMTRSPIALAISSSVIPWYNERAKKDEERLTKIFGQDYTSYKDKVPRWLPIPKIVRNALSSQAA